MDNSDYAPEIVLGTAESAHMLLENRNKLDVHSFFCLLQGQKVKTICGCRINEIYLISKFSGVKGLKST